MNKCQSCHFSYQHKSEIKCSHPNHEALTDDCHDYEYEAGTDAEESNVP